MTSLRRRVDRVNQAAQADWVASWDAWCLRLVRLWRRFDPDGRAHHALALSVEQRWASLGTDEEASEFLAWGEARAVELDLPPGLWTWFWRDAYGARLRGDLSVWPEQMAGTCPVASAQLRTWVNDATSDPVVPGDPGLRWALVMAALAASLSGA